IPASSVQVFSFTTPRPPTPTLFPYTTLFRSAPRCWFGGVHVAAMTSDDAIELGQRLDLIDDHAPHLRGALRRLLRQLEDALAQRSEEHTSELQSLTNIVCRLLLEKKKYHNSC